MGSSVASVFGNGEGSKAATQRTGYRGRWRLPVSCLPFSGTATVQQRLRVAAVPPRTRPIRPRSVHPSIRPAEEMLSVLTLTLLCIRGSLTGEVPIF